MLPLCTLHLQKITVPPVDNQRMKRGIASRVWVRLLVALILAAALLMPSGMQALAQEPHLGGVVAADPPQTMPAGKPELGALGSGFKAVYIVGDVDGVDGPTTQQYIAQARDQAQQLRSLGFTVVEFYAPDNHWSDIVAAVTDAQAIIYAGHGIRWGGDDALVGGMKLNASESVHPDQIRSDLRMAPGAVVILNHTCYSAGTGTEDIQGTDFETAVRRASQYSQPFLDAGLSGYYASWYYGFPAAVLTSLASGLTLGEAYEAYHDFNPETVTRLTHPLSPDHVLWLDYDNWTGWEGLQYNYAFAGDPDALLGEAPSPTFALSQPELSTYATIGGAAQTVTIQVTAEGSPSWDAWVEGGSQPWLTLEPKPDEGVLLVHLQPPAAAGNYAAQVIVQPLYYPPLRLSVSLLVGHLTLLPAIIRAG